MLVGMASTMFPVHKNDIHCLRLSVPADIQEPDEAKLVPEETKGSGQK
jgi:hypothetical protein